MLLGIQAGCAQWALEACLRLLLGTGAQVGGGGVGLHWSSDAC